jgi:hypothetical protein
MPNFMMLARCCDEENNLRTICYQLSKLNLWNLNWMPKAIPMFNLNSCLQFPNFDSVSFPYIIIQDDKEQIYIYNVRTNQKIRIEAKGVPLFFLPEIKIKTVTLFFLNESVCKIDFPLTLITKMEKSVSLFPIVKGNELLQEKASQCGKVMKEIAEVN